MNHGRLRGAGRVERGANILIRHHSAQPNDRPGRSMDVICAGMYRACSTWQYEVVAHLLERHFGGRRLGYLTAEQYAALVRFDARDGTSAPGPGALRKLVWRRGGWGRGRHSRPAPSPPRLQPPEQRPSWRVLKSHEGHRAFARALAEGRALAVYAYRDVRDVVFSLMHKRGWTFEQVLRQGMIRQILANDHFWTRRPNVLIQRYDELLADPVGGVLGLARHLGIELAEDEAARIAEEYSLGSNKARTEALRRRLEQAGLDLNEAANAQICDPSTLLHWNHVRSGGTGTWINEATPMQRIILDRLCRRWLHARDYPLRPAGAAADAAESHLGWRGWLRLEADLAVGWLNYLVRTASQRFPRLARMAKRILGNPAEGQAGATVWSESKRESPGGSSAR